MRFELVPADEPEGYSDKTRDEDEYEEPCMECGGRVWATGGNNWYNGSYSCYTLYLECENCGPYDVECV